LFLVFNAHGQKECLKGQKQHQATVVEAIKETWNEYIELWKQGDATACAAFYTEDGINMPAYNSTQNGHVEVEALFVNFLSSTTVDEVIQNTNEVFVHDSMAYEFGSLEQTLHRQGREPVTVKNRYISVLKQQSDGSWKFHRWMSQPKCSGN
jgi:uncharacterized protein (TIGR02246 family)